MKINYFYRNSRSGYSIAKVFTTITSEIRKTLVLREIYLPSSNASICSIIKNLFFTLKNRNLHSINHITGDVHYLTLALQKRHTVVTVHDIMYYSYLKGVKKKLWKWLYINTLKNAAKVVFISEESKKMVLCEVQLPENKILVIPNPVSPDINYVKKEFNAEKPVILHIGTLERKNLNRTIEAISGFNCHLRIIGKLNNSNMVLLNKFKINFSNGLNLTDEEIMSEYINCDIVNFPSVLEGFGMPIIEGQATGRVVVTSNLSPMKEVAGEGAFFVNPYEVQSIRDAYIEIIKNKSVREELIQKGIENVKKYQVSEIARQYIEVYNSIAKLK